MGVSPVIDLFTLVCHVVDLYPVGDFPLHQAWGTCSMEGRCGCGIMGWPPNQPKTEGSLDWN